MLNLAAFLVRGLAMDRFPICTHGDDGRDGIEAVQVLKGEFTIIYFGWLLVPLTLLFLPSSVHRFLLELPRHCDSHRLL